MAKYAYLDHIDYSVQPNDKYYSKVYSSLAEARKGAMKRMIEGGYNSTHIINVSKPIVKIYKSKPNPNKLPWDTYNKYQDYVPGVGWGTWWGCGSVSRGRNNEFTYTYINNDTRRTYNLNKDGSIRNIDSYSNGYIVFEDDKDGYVYNGFISEKETIDYLKAVLALGRDCSSFRVYNRTTRKMVGEWKMTSRGWRKVPQR